MSTRVLVPSVVVAALITLGSFDKPAEARRPRKGRLTPNVELMGGDLRRVPLGRRYWTRGGPQRCVQICRATAGCVAVVTKQRSCYLKRAIGRSRGLARAWVWINPRPRRAIIRPNRRRVTPSRQPPHRRTPHTRRRTPAPRPRGGSLPAPGALTRDVELLGQGLGTSRFRGAARCRAWCNANTRCVGFTFKRGYCLYLRSIGSSKRTRGAVAWVKPRGASRTSGTSRRAPSSPRAPGTSRTPPRSSAKAGAIVPGRCLDGSPLLTKGYTRGSAKKCIDSCRFHGPKCRAAVWEPVSRNQPLQGWCKLFTRADLSKPDRRGRGHCRMWLKTDAMVAAERRAKAACAANKRNPQSVKTPHGACRGHGRVWTTWGLQNVLSFRHKAVNYGGGLYHPGPFLSFDKGAPPSLRDRVKHDFSRWYIMPVGRVLPASSLRKNTIKVHIHSYDDPTQVLKRQGDRVVMGPPDQNALWSVENSWEYSNYNIPKDPFKLIPYVWTGKLVVLRHASGPGHRFLSAKGGRLTLSSDPRHVRSHWRFGKAENVGIDGTRRCRPPSRMRQKQAPLIADAPRPPMDMALVNKLATWVVKQHANAQPDVCWKRGGGGDCKKLDRVRSVNCGAACTKSSMKCAKTVVDKVRALGEMVASISALVASAGVGSAVTAVTKTAAKAGTKMAMKMALRMAVRVAGRILKKSLMKMRTNVKKYIATRLNKQMATGAKILTAEGRRVLDAAMARRHADVMTDEVLRRAGERIYLASKPKWPKELLDAVEAIDPTGIVGVVRAFHHPKCGNVPMPR